MDSMRSPQGVSTVLMRTHTDPLQVHYTSIRTLAQIRKYGFQAIQFGKFLTSIYKNSKL